MGFKKHLESLPLYEAGKPIELVARDYGILSDDIIKLASNENPLGTSKKALKALKKEMENAYRYPDDSMWDLKDALAKKYRVYRENIIIGSGSDQIIEFVINAVCSRGSKVLMSATTFAMYEIYAKHCEANIIRTKSGIHIVDEFLSEYKRHKPELIFLCLPNNPLGDCLRRDEVYRILDSVSKDTIVVLDCAYMEFARHKDASKELYPNEIVEKYSNVLYLGTFSKLYGLGGLRIGYGIASGTIIRNLSKLRAPFNVTTLSLKAAAAALKDKDFVRETLENNFSQMSVYENFARENNIRFIPSYTNFITFMLEGKLDSTKMCEYLLKNGIIIRDLNSYKMNAVRITIGTPKQNKRVLKFISKFIKRQ